MAKRDWGFGKEYWRIAKRFFEKAELENSIIYYSGYLLKELYFLVNHNIFQTKKSMFENSSNFQRVNLTGEEYNLAKKIEMREEYKISFYDIIHVLLAKKQIQFLLHEIKSY